MPPGSVISQGDVAGNAAALRLRYGVDGTGVLVGILADSFDCLNGAAADRVSGDLPASVAVLAEDDGCGAGRFDTGRAIAQIVVDLAPGARLAFHAVNGRSDPDWSENWPAAIGALADCGARIIVDATPHLRSTMFQDDPVAQAVASLAARSVLYVAAAGDRDAFGYQAEFRSGGIEPITGKTAHDFDPDDAVVDLYQRVTVPEEIGALVVLQWQQPAATAGGPGAQSDLDFYLLDDPPTRVLHAAARFNIHGDPREVVDVWNDPADELGESYNLAIVHSSGAPPGRIGYVMHWLNGPRGGRIEEHDTESATLYGAANARGALAVGSVDYSTTPAWGWPEPAVDPSSSRGGMPILFLPDGTPAFEARLKPDLVCITNINNTFFGVLDRENDGAPNFRGSAAAAAHTAAIAALLLELDATASPKRIANALVAGALDLAEPGFDFDSGHGLCDALRAGGALLPLFTDGFESGSTGAWSGAVPAAAPDRSPKRRRGWSAVTGAVPGSGTAAL